MHVTLLTYTPDPERTVACAARLCYSPAGIDEVMDKLTDEKTASFVDMLAEIGHESPIEHASFTFGIEGVSRSLLAQITRHRIASFSVQSQRYVAENRFDYVLPPEIEALPRPRPSIARRWRRTRLIMRSSPACSRININKSCSPPAWRKGRRPAAGKSAPLRMRVLVLPNAWHDQNDRDYERPQPAKFLSPPLL